MRFLSRAVTHVSVVLSVAFTLLAFAPSISHATDVRFVGTVTYSFSGNTAVLTASRIENFSASGTSGTLRMELWALSSPYTGGSFTGYKLAQYQLGQLSPGFFYSNVSSGTVVYTPPPNGTWRFVMMLTEFNNASFNDGYFTISYVNFSPPVVVGPPPPPPPPTITPHTGIWWNPNESGTGYAVEYRNGTLVFLTYSYQSNGAPQWYFAAGALSGNTFTATLDKYFGGQCISCSYTGSPAQIGNDGTITIVFSSATTATAYLPGGRVTPIQVFVF